MPHFLFGGAEHYVSLLAGKHEPDTLYAECRLDGGGRGPGALWPGRRSWSTGGAPFAASPCDCRTASADTVGSVRAFDDDAPDIIHVVVPTQYSGRTGLLVPLARIDGSRS